MIEDPKQIWRLANVLERKCAFEYVGQTEWVRVNPIAADGNFQAWLGNQPVQPGAPVFIVRDVREIDESDWRTVLSEWDAILVEGTALRIMARDYTWILVFHEIGIAKFGTMKSTSEALESSD